MTCVHTMNSDGMLMVIMHTVLDALLASHAHVQQERKVVDEFHQLKAMRAVVLICVIFLNSTLLSCMSQRHHSQLPFASHQEDAAVNSN